MPRGRNFSEPLIKICLHDICQGLKHIAAHKYVHGDIKPDNLLISDAGSRHKFPRIVIADFGTSHLLAGSEEEIPKEIGTTQFLSPELKRKNHKIIGSFTDVYCLGLTLFDMCSVDLAREEKNSVFFENDLTKFHISECYSSDLRKCIKQMIDPDYKKRPSAAEILREDWL